MLKLMGAMLILFSCAGVGFRAAHRLRERPYQIRQLQAAFSLLETEITYGARHLNEICDHLAQREKAPMSRLFSRFATFLSSMDGVSTYECWKAAVEKTWPETAMKVAEREILLDFGKTLGVSDRANQLQHLRRLQANLEAEEKRAREDELRYEKMCKSLGILTGALIVILIY